MVCRETYCIEDSVELFIAEAVEMLVLGKAANNSFNERAQSGIQVALVIWSDDGC